MIRESWSLAMAALLVSGGPLAGQRRQETRQVLLLANYTETAVLRPANPQQERPFAVDPAERVYISILSNSTTLEVTLVDPGGGLHPLGVTDGIVRASFRGPSLSPTAKPSYEFELRNPPAGMWKYRVRESSSFSDARVVIFSLVSSSDLAAAVLGGGRDYPVNRPITLGLVLAAQEGGLPAPAIDSAQGEVQLEREPALPISFRDDGSGNDEAAGDGVYTAEFTLRTPGTYIVRANVSGTRGGAPFQRSAFASFTAVSACGSLDRNFQSRPRDTNNNARPDVLDLIVNVNVTRAGKFQVAATLANNGGSQQSTAMVDLTAGSLRPATVAFPLTALRLLGNGPYQLSELRLGCLEGSEIRTADQLFDLGRTAPFDLAAAERRVIELSGANTDRGVDTNNNRLFDRLEFGVGMDLLSAGAFQWSGALFDSRGNEVDFASGSGSRPRGRATASLTFSGLKIGRNAVDGPYLVRNFLISGGGGSAVLPNVGPTLAYSYDAFEGAPARAAGPRIGAGGTVDAASFRQTLAPGAIASLFGTSLAAATGVATAVPLPLELAGVRVTVDGLDAPLFFVSPTQINFQAPAETRVGSVGVVVKRGSSASPPAIVAVAANAPGIFTYERVAGTRDPIVLHADGGLVTPANPARAGEILIVFGTGIGDLENEPPSGAAAPARPLARARVNPTVTVGGVAAESLFAGLTPGFVGLGQFNIRLPDRLPSGSSLPLIIRIGAASSQTVNLAAPGDRPRAGTTQNFDAPGTPHAGANYAFPPTHPNVAPLPAVLPGGPTGNYLRLKDYTIRTVNTLGFDRTDAGAASRITADVDFRITCRGDRIGFGLDGCADGFSMIFLNTSRYGTTGAPPAFDEAGRQVLPGVTDSFAVGFSVFDPGFGTDFPINRVWITYNNAIRGSVLIDRAILDLATGARQTPGGFLHLFVDLVLNGPTPNVTVRISNGTRTVTPYNNFSLAAVGLGPHESRLGFGTRSGDVGIAVDLDNINIQYQP